MTYPISEIEGLPAFAANKLKAQGIRTTDALLEAASTVKGRKALSARTGISEQQLLEWANVSDYMRIPGMGRAKVGLGDCLIYATAQRIGALLITADSDLRGEPGVLLLRNPVP